MCRIRTCSASVCHSLRAATLEILSAKSSVLGFARRIWVISFAVAAMALMAYVVLEHQATLAAIDLTRPWLLLVAAAFHCTFWLVGVVLWRYLVRVTASRTLSMSESHHQLSLVAVGKYIPGKVSGFLARGAALKKFDMSTREILAASFVEQWAMLMSAGLVSGVILLLIRPNGTLTALGVAAIVTSLLGNHFFRFFVSVFQRVLSIVSDSSATQVGMPLGYHQYFVLLLMHSLTWILLGSVLVSIYFAFSTQPFSLKLSAALVLANIVGFLVGFAAIFAPGGLGVREAVTATVLIPYIPLEQAATLSVVFRVWITAIDALLASGLVWQTTLARLRARK